jgi:hypothetical protein
MVTVLRPLSTSELLDRTFHLYRNNFLMFAGIAAIPQIPVLGLRLTDSALLLRQVIPSRGIRTAIFYLSGFLAVEIAHAATVSAVSRLHLGQPADIASAYGSSARSMPRAVVSASIAVVLALLFGFVVCVMLIWGVGFFVVGLSVAIWIRGATVLLAFLAAFLLAIRLWTRWSLIVPIAVLERSAIRPTMRRSRSLTEDRRPRIFAVCIVVVALTWIVSILFQTPFYYIAGWRGLSRQASISNIGVTMSAIGNFASTSLVGPLLTIALTLIYYDERVRKEGFDLELMMSRLEGGSVANVAAAPAGTGV